MFLQLVRPLTETLRHIYFDAAASSQSKPSDMNLVPGQEWAERARKEILAEIHTPTVQHVMVQCPTLIHMLYMLITR